MSSLEFQSQEIDNLTIFLAPFPGEVTPKRDHDHLLKALTKMGYSTKEDNLGQVFIYRQYGRRVIKTYWNKEGRIVRTENFKPTKSRDDLKINRYGYDNYGHLNYYSHSISLRKRPLIEVSFIHPPEKPEEYSIILNPSKEEINISYEERKRWNLNLFLTLEAQGITTL